LNACAIGDKAKHRGLEVLLYKESWHCVDSFAEDQLVMPWREFHIHPRDNLYQPIACELWLYHHCASMIMGGAGRLQQVAGYHLGHGGQT